MQYEGFPKTGECVAGECTAQRVRSNFSLGLGLHSRAQNPKIGQKIEAATYKERGCYPNLEMRMGH